MVKVPEETHEIVPNCHPKWIQFQIVDRFQ